MAVRDENYTSYDGPLHEGRAWWPVAAQTFRSAVGFLRTKLVVLLLWIAPIVAAVGVVAEYTMLQQSASNPSPAVVSGLLRVQFYSLAGLFAASGCNAVSDDLQYDALRLYASKPIELWEYAAGKVAGLFALGALVTILPTTVVGGLRIAMLGAGDYGTTAAAQVGWSLLIATGMTVVLSAIMAGVSSLSGRTWRVFLAWIGIILVPVVVGLIVNLAPGGGPWGDLLSLQGNFTMVADLALKSSSLPVPVWSPFAVLVTVMAIGLATLYWQLRRRAALD
ncbi:MAG: hypothetical protein ABEL76_02705 [Bradymonadaceae bacterium]